MARLDRRVMARGAKAALRRVGLEVSRAERGPRRTLAGVLGHARTLGVSPATLIDVGVASGTPELYEAFPTADLLLVEPMDEWRSALESLHRHRREVHVETVAAGREPGELTLYVHRVPACSSVLGARAGDAQGVEPRVVPVATVDALVARNGCRAPFVMKVDVEGAELEVIAGATNTLSATALLLLEVSLFQLVPNGAEIGDVVCAMRDLGWSVYDIYNGHLRPIDGALAQVDIAFARDDGPLRSVHEYATPEQADRLYRSWGR